MYSKPIKTKSYYPVSLDEAKRHLRVDQEWSKDDDYIRGLIEAATQKCEEYIGKDIALTSNVLAIYDFVGPDLYLEEGNFISLDSVKQSDASTSISVDHTEILYNRVYIELSSHADQDPLYLYYTTGFAAGACPALIKQAVLVKIADLYDDQRSSYSNGTSKNENAYERLLDSFKLILY